MEPYDAFRRALERVDESNWRGALDALHGQAGSWRAVAGQLGVDKRTVERWRFGYVDKRTGQRRQIGERAVKANVLPKVRKAFKANRRAQVARVDWRKLNMSGPLQIGNYPPRHQAMMLGAYLSPEAIAGLADAYISGDPDRMSAALDDALSQDYTGTGDASLGDVDGLDFG